MQGASRFCLFLVLTSEFHQRLGENDLSVMSRLPEQVGVTDLQMRERRHFWIYRCPFRVCLKVLKAGRVEFGGRAGGGHGGRREDIVVH